MSTKSRRQVRRRQWGPTVYDPWEHNAGVAYRKRHRVRLSLLLPRMAGAVAAAAASSGFVNAAVTAAAALEEARARIEATFGKASEEMNRWATERREGLTR